MDLEDSLSIDDAEKQKRLFILGLFILFGWMLVIVLCAYPQLFRDLLIRYVCCCFAGFALHRRTKCNQNMDDKVKRAQERVRSASKSFISVSMAANAELLKQVGLAELGTRMVADCEEGEFEKRLRDTAMEELRRLSIQLRRCDDDNNDDQEGGAYNLLDVELKEFGTSRVKHTRESAQSRHWPSAPEGPFTNQLTF